MRPEHVFFDGITHIREELIEEAQRYVFRRRVHWQRYAGLTAACLVLALGLSLLFQSGGMGGSGSNSGGVSGDTASGGNSSPYDAPEAAEPPGESSFIADVAEILPDGSLLVIPQPGSGVWSVADRVTVPVYDVWDMPDVQPGDRILVVYTGEAGENFVEGVTAIEPLD